MIGAPRSTRRAPLAAALIAACALLAGCDREAMAARAEQPEPGLAGRLVLTGSSTVAPLASEIARRFEQRHPGVRIDVQSGGSSRGIADALAGRAHLGMASRALAPGEREQGLRAHTLAVDGVALVAHASRPIDALTAEQVRAVYTGALTSWSALGAGDGAIVVVDKAAGRATREVFHAWLGLPPDAVHADLVVGENAQAIKTIAGQRDALGYVSIGEAERESERGTPLRLLAVDGVEPTRASVADGRFPVTRPLNLVSRGAPAGLAAAFVDFARSDAVHDLVEAERFVPVAR